MMAGMVYYKLDLYSNFVIIQDKNSVLYFPGVKLFYNRPEEITVIENADMCDW